MKKHLTDDQVSKYRDNLLAAERGIEIALQTISGLELGGERSELWTDLNHALALVQSGLRKDHLLRDWGE